MSTVAQKKFYTLEEYLVLENASPYRSEYFRGEIFAMTGASLNHNRICSSILSSLHAQLKGKPCEPFMSDQRIGIPALGLFTYPDVSVICGEPEFEKRDDRAIVNPRVIFEVLSPSTESYDRGKKFDFYRQLVSLAEYILVAQDAPHIERFVRQADNSWLLTVAKGLDASLPIDAIQCRLSLAEVYDRVTFEPPTLPDSGPTETETSRRPS